MKPIWMHEYTITAARRKDVGAVGIRSIVITVVSDKSEGDGIEAVQMAMQFFENDLNISHRTLFTGYENV